MEINIIVDHDNDNIIIDAQDGKVISFKVKSPKDHEEILKSIIDLIKSDNSDELDINLDRQIDGECVTVESW